MVLRRGRRFNMATGHTLKYQPQAPRRGYMAGFTGEYGIVKRMKGSREFMNHYLKIVDDGGMEPSSGYRGGYDDVMYSMNKCKRWLLPSLLEENINETSLHEDLDYKVIMVEWCRASGQTVWLYTNHSRHCPDCKAVHDSKFEAKKCRTAKQKYSYETDLRSKTTHNYRAQLQLRRRERARTGVRIDVGSRLYRRNHYAPDGEPFVPELKYEICRPRPKHQYPWHSGKVYKTASFGLEYSKSQVQLRSNNGHWDSYVSGEHPEDLCIDGELYYTSSYQIEEDAMFWSDEEEEDSGVSSKGKDANADGYVLGPEGNADDAVDDEESILIPGSAKPTCLGAFIVPDLPSNSQCNPRRKPSCSKNRMQHTRHPPRLHPNHAMSQSVRMHEKGCAIYEPQTGQDNEQNVGISSDESVASDSAFGLSDSLAHSHDLSISWMNLGTVASDAITPEQLTQEYGNAYTEGNSIPRRFSVGVKCATTRSAAVSLKALFEVDENPMNPAMPFDLNLRMRLYSTDIDVASISTWRLEESLSKGDTVNAAVNNIQKFLSDQVSREEFAERKFASPHRARVVMDTVQCMMGWKFDVSTVDKVKAELEEEEVTKQSKNCCDDPSNQDDWVKLHSCGADSCGICYQDLAPSVDNGQKGTALLTCSHWFCDDCWTRHIASRVQMNEINIKCPAYRCQSVIDKTTIFSLLPDSLTGIYMDRIHDNRISNHAQWHWCPNPKCGRLVKVRASNSKTVKSFGVPVLCKCSVAWCSECKEEAHWPATCQQAANHMKQVKNSGMASRTPERITYVQVKCCPSCRQPMEKNGGCMQMVCRCGFEFCWECLGPWKEHDFEAWTFRCPQSFESLEKFYLSSRRVPSIFLDQLAIENRKRKTWDIVGKQYSAAVSLAKRMFLETDFMPANDEQTVLSIPSSWCDTHVFSLTSWLTLPDDQSRLTVLMMRANHMVAFCIEARALLEYLSVLVGQGPRRLKAGSNGWKKMIQRLMFITWRIEELLHTTQGTKPRKLWETITVLMHCGKQCFQEIIRTIPSVHQRLVIRGQGSKSILVTKKEKQKLTV